MSDIEKRVEAIQGIRRAFDKVKHHAKLTKKLETAIKEELPAYSVSFSNDDWGKLTIWGNGLSYDNPVFLCWNSDRTKSNWQQVIQEQIDIADFSDYQERLQQESAIEPSLAELATKAKQLEEELQRVRKDALHAIAQIPVPKCATVRKEPHFWKRPSEELTKKFPELFNER